MAFCGIDDCEYVSVIGWAVIPLEFSYVTDKFSFRSWNFFIIVCAIPSLLVGFWMLTFPETPKYLAESKQEKKLARALEIMYAENTGRTFDEYLVSLENSYSFGIYMSPGQHDPEKHLRVDLSL